jgi:D-sedoheptulose 7-phosphate isomerase
MASSHSSLSKSRHDEAELLDATRLHLLGSAELKRKVAERCAESIVAAAGVIANAFRQGGKVLLCGNGGSAADCQHMAGELINLLTVDFARPPLPAVALTTDSSVLTACANDSGFEGVFSRQVQALGKRGDVLIGISTSGNSQNILRAVEAARSIQMHTIGLTGQGGRLKEIVDVAIAVPAEGVQHIQEAHLAIEHVLCHLIERDLFEALSVGGRHSDDH